MSEHEHEDIARRLRETGTVKAPERLRADVMDQVRAEPRMRPSRRSYLMPVLPYAAAAAALAVVVLAIAQLGGGGSGSSSGGGSSGGAGAGGERSPTSSGNPTLTPNAAGVAPGKTIFHLGPTQAQKLSTADGVKARSPSEGTIIVTVPRSEYTALRKRLHKIERRTHRTGRIRVILRPAR